MGDIHALFHGSDRIVEKPLFGVGKDDNDYGSGFYTTENIEKANEYGSLSWIAEIIAHRGTRSGEAEILGNAIVEKYKVDTSNVDIIIGYRADDSYIDIVDAFLKNQLSIDEVERLFRKGNLGEQVFIKSEKAFESIKFTGYKNVDIDKYSNLDEIQARTDVARFLKQRSNAIYMSNFTPPGILARDAASNNLIYNAETNYYEFGKEIEKDGFEYGDD